MREQFGILGLGQCGGNIANIFETKYNYPTVYVNTSREDLASIKGVHKIHARGSEGAAKDRVKALKSAMGSFSYIIEKTKSILTQKYILVIYSAGGGTGSGLSTPILRYFAEIGKICIPIVVLPDDKVESAKACENAYNACVELMSIQGLGATFLLDNSRGDKFVINNRFVQEFDTFINIQNLSKYGNMDIAERKQILSCPGVAVIGKTSKAKSTASDIVHSLHNGIYAEIESKIAYYLGISTSNKSLSINSIASEFESIYDVFSGVSESTTIAIVSGLQWPMKRIEEFKNKFEKTVQNINSTIIHQPLTIKPIQGLSFTREEFKPNPSVNPRDILMGLLNN